jgi:hypothetical protein
MGGSTQADPGPVTRTWRTRNRTDFNDIVLHRGVGGGTAPNVEGSFHRIE